MLKYLKDELSENIVSRIYGDIKESIGVCKSYAAEAKRLRIDNRERMSKMFKKLEKVKIK